MSESNKKGDEEVVVEFKKPYEKVIRNHVYLAVAGGLLPVPLLDMASVMAIQQDMLKELCKLFDVEYSTKKSKTWLMALSGSSLARLGASMIKALPGVGSIVGGASMAVLSGASTHAIGQVFATHFQSGGDLENINVEHFKDFYKQKFEEGKEVASRIKDQIKKKAKKDD